MEIGFGNRLARHLVTQISNDCIADEEPKRKLVDLRTAGHIMLGRIDMTAGMQTHVHAAHDLSGSAWRIMLLEDLHRELQILCEASGRAHCEVPRVEL